MSGRAKEALAHYRAAEGMSPAARARVLQGVSAKIGAPASLAPKAALATKGVAGTVAKIAVGAALAVAAGVGAHRLAKVAEPTASAPKTIEAAALGPDAPRDTRSGTTDPERAAPPPEPLPPSTNTLPGSREPTRPSAARGSPRGASSGFRPAPSVAAGATASPANADETSSSAGASLAPSGASSPSHSAAPAAEPATDVAPSTASGSPAPKGPDAIAEELELLQRAQSAIKAGRPAEALAELEEHARRFPHGKLSESREVARIVALCDAGQKAASHAAAAHFLATRPNSPFAHRVRSACGGVD